MSRRPPHAQRADARRLTRSRAAAQHLMTLGELAEKHSVALDCETPQKSAGLTAADAEARLAVWGRNVLTPPKQRPLWLQFLLKARPTRGAAQASKQRSATLILVDECAARLLGLTPGRRHARASPARAQFTDKFMVLLLLSGGLCHLAYGCALAAPFPWFSPAARSCRPSPSRGAPLPVAYLNHRATRRLDETQPVNLYLGLVLYAVVIVTCTVTFLQDKATADVMASIQGMMASSTAVIRDGTEKRIDPTLLVPGDVVRLCLGDRVPADLRIIFTADLRTECSSLTGEPDAIAATVVAAHEAPLECRNVVFSSSLVMNGEGFGVVIKTGDNTMSACPCLHFVLPATSR